MKKIYSLLIMVVGVCCTAYSQDDVQQVCQVTSPPAIDGKMDDWQGDWQTDDDSKFQYNVCFDAENIFIRVKTADDMNQGKMGRFGFTIWLDPNGKKKKKLGLKYPTDIGRDFSQMMNQNPNDSRSREDKRLGMKRDLIKDTEVLELIGLAKDNIVSSRVGLKNGIQVIIVMDEKGDYVYEGKIPFKAYKLDKASIPVLGIGFETGKLAPTQGQPYSDMSKATSFWMSVKLN